MNGSLSPFNPATIFFCGKQGHGCPCFFRSRTNMRKYANVRHKQQRMVRRMGSGLVTSSPAPQMIPSLNASVRSSSLCIAPLAELIKIEVLFILTKTSRLKRPRVSGVSAVWTDNTSLFSSKSSKDTRRAPNSLSASGWRPRL